MRWAIYQEKGKGKVNEKMMSYQKLDCWHQIVMIYKIGFVSYIYNSWLTFIEWQNHLRIDCDIDMRLGSSYSKPERMGYSLWQKLHVFSPN